jgi:hypothetical protein
MVELCGHTLMINIITRNLLQSLELQYLAGSTLLQTVDEFALNNHNTSSPPVTSDNIGMIIIICVR